MTKNDHTQEWMIKKIILSRKLKLHVSIQNKHANIVITSAEQFAQYAEEQVKGRSSLYILYIPKEDIRNAFNYLSLSPMQPMELT